MDRHALELIEGRIKNAKESTRGKGFEYGKGLEENGDTIAIKRLHFNSVSDRILDGM